MPTRIARRASRSIPNPSANRRYLVGEAWSQRRVEGTCNSRHGYALVAIEQQDEHRDRVTVRLASDVMDDAHIGMEGRYEAVGFDMTSLDAVEGLAAALLAAVRQARIAGVVPQQTMSQERVS